MNKENKDISEKVSEEAKKKLIEVLNDSPSIIKLSETDYPIRALKMGTKWKICEVFKDFKDAEGITDNVIISMASNIPIIVKVVVLAILNDKNKIEKEFDNMYNDILWKCTESDLSTLLMDILQKLDTDFFFTNIKLSKTFLELTAERKMTSKEREQYLQGQN